MQIEVHQTGANSLIQAESPLMRERAGIQTCAARALTGVMGCLSMNTECTIQNATVAGAYG